MTKGIRDATLTRTRNEISGASRIIDNQVAGVEGAVSQMHLDNTIQRYDSAAQQDDNAAHQDDNAALPDDNDEEEDVRSAMRQLEARVFCTAVIANAATRVDVKGTTGY